MQSGLQTVMVGRLAREPYFMDQVRDNVPTGNELLYISVATDQKGYTDQQGQFQKTTGFFTVLFTFKKGMMDDWKRKNLLAKGHLVMVTDIILLEQAKMHENKPVPNNLWVQDDANSFYPFNSIKVLSAPHAVRDNGQTPLPAEEAQTSQQAPAPQQQGGFQQNQPNQAQSAKVNPQEPTIDFDDDIPFLRNT